MQQEWFKYLVPKLPTFAWEFSCANDFPAGLSTAFSVHEHLLWKHLHFSCNCTQGPKTSATSPDFLEYSAMLLLPGTGQRSFLGHTGWAACRYLPGELPGARCANLAGPMAPTFPCKPLSREIYLERSTSTAGHYTGMTGQLFSNTRDMVPPLHHKVCSIRPVAVELQPFSLRVSWLQAVCCWPPGLSWGLWLQAWLGTW